MTSSTTGNDGCVFCGIASGKVPAEIVYQDDDTVAFLDLRQVRSGHTLVIPRAHAENLLELDEALGSAVMATARRVAHAAYQAFEPEGLSLWQSNGPAAFQEVPHFHLHVLPRWHNDRMLRIYPTSIAEIDANFDLDEFLRQGEALRTAIAAS